MAKKQIRFGVKDLNGLISSTWKCWISKGVGKNNIYIAQRGLGGKTKISLHQTGDYRQRPGDYRLSYIKDFLDEEAPAESDLHKDRAVERWSALNNAGPGITLAVRIYISNNCVSKKIGPKTKSANIIWAEKPEDKTATLFLFYITEKEVKVSSWPAKKSMGSKFIGSLGLDDGRTIWIVYFGENINQIHKKTGRGTKFNSANVHDLEDRDLRVIFHGIAKDGSLSLIEAPIQLVKKGDNIDDPFSNLTLYS